MPESRKTHLFKQALIGEQGMPCEEPELDARVVQKIPQWTPDLLQIDLDRVSLDQRGDELAAEIWESEGGRVAPAQV